MKVEHTPAPWVAVNHGGYWDVRDAEGLVVATLWGPRVNHRTPEQIEVNVRLMTAAPRLLKALDRLVKEHDENDPDLWLPLLDAWWADAKEALDEARSEAFICDLCGKPNSRDFPHDECHDREQAIADGAL